MITHQVAFDVSRLKVVFVDGVGNDKTISGSGFWIKSESKRIFVTNKHNLDPILKLGLGTDFHLHQVSIELRKFDGNSAFAITSFFKVDLEDTEIKLSPSADVSIIIDPCFKEDPKEFRNSHMLAVEDLADAEFLKEYVAMMDLASFIGFPGDSESRWWDDVWNLGIARTVNIASMPGIPFSSKEIKTADIMLVSGLSFSGSSGSVVILHQKGIQGSSTIRTTGYVPYKIIGVMSGHWERPGDEPKMLRHSGLSYLTRSTSILALL